MSFRHRLALFLVVTLVAVQALTAVFAYGYLRANVVDRAKMELKAATEMFSGQLAILSEGAAEDVKILSLDYALRQAIAQRDRETEISALRNHGRRVGAARMMLVDLSGMVSADTGERSEVGRTFDHSDLLNAVADSDQGTAISAIDGRVYWIVVVPVRAPVPIAFIAAFIPVDDALLERLRHISGTERAIALVTRTRAGHWLLAARSRSTPGLATSPAALDGLSGASKTVVEEGTSDLAVLARLKTAAGSAPVVAVLTSSLDSALAPYRSLIWPLLAVLAASLAAALIGAMLIVRSMSRPLEALANAAGRIADGDYAPPTRLKQKGELGQLSDALIAMTRSIAEREAQLTHAMSTAELARGEAERANLAKSQFLANMSHELRTPLNAIMGFGQMLHEQVLGPIGVARYGEYARDICESATRLLDLVSRMLDVAESERGRLEIVHQEFAPLAVVQQCVALSRGLADAGAVALAVHVAVDASARANGDPAKLRQAFSNLIHNAIKFTPEGGTVTIRGAAEDGRLKVTIEDTGVGMKREEIAVVTRPFHRLRSAFDGLHQGAGLGLPFARAIIELHGGTLEIDSEPGKGTRVNILLPLLSASRAEAA